MRVCSVIKARLRGWGSSRRTWPTEKDVDSVDGDEPGFTEFLEDPTLGGDASAEKAEFVRKLRFKGKRLTALQMSASDPVGSAALSTCVTSTRGTHDRTIQTRYSSSRQ